MGNVVAPCCQPCSKSAIKLIFYEGTTRIIKGKCVAGEIMFEFPDMMVCHADSFFIGRPVPMLSIEDKLVSGQTYLVLPLDCFSSSSSSSSSASTGALSASSIAALASSPQRTPINFDKKPFEYIKGSNGRALIKVSPEFLIRALVGEKNKELISSDKSTAAENGFLLCSTPELKKHYEQLVGTGKERPVWSPKLDTISEYNVRFSPCRFIGLEWKQTEPR